MSEEPNPSHYTKVLTRFEWTGKIPWPTYSYRLGNWEWAFNPDGRNLLVYNVNAPLTYRGRDERGFYAAMNLTISDLVACEVLRRLQECLGDIEDINKDFETIHEIIKDLVKNFPRRKGV